ncbi:MAG: hypothetical protein ACI398_02385 [Clostridium sp.]
MELKILNNNNHNYINSTNKYIHNVKNNINKTFSNVFNNYKNSQNIKNNLYKNTTVNSKIVSKEITDPDCLKRLKEWKEEFNTEEARENCTQSIEMIENVMKLDIKNNKGRYFDSNGKLNIEKVFNDCGISLDNCTPKESAAIFTELSQEGFISKKQAFNVRALCSTQVCINDHRLKECGIYNVSGFDIKGNFNMFLKSQLENTRDQYYRDILYDIINLVRN